MDCGITLFSSNGWLAFLTWIAFAVVSTFAVTFLAVGRGAARREAASAGQSEIERLAVRLDAMGKRLEELERRQRSG